MEDPKSDGSKSIPSRSVSMIHEFGFGRFVLWPVGDIFERVEPCREIWVLPLYGYSLQATETRNVYYYP